MKRFILLFAGCLFLINCSKNKQEVQAEVPEKGPVLVEMKLEAQRHVGLQVETISERQLTEYLQVTGTVQSIDSMVGQVRPLGRGRVLRVFAKVGDRVTGGQKLAEIDNIEASELLTQEESARAELQRYRVQLATRTKQIDRIKRLVDIGASPQKEFEAAQGEQLELQQTIRSQESVVNGISARLRRFGAEEGSLRGPVVTNLGAPFAGVVTKARVASGDFVDTGSELFTIADISQVWVQAEVYEKDLGRIRVGQNAFISVDTYPNQEFEGRVSYISDVLDPQTRTARVRCELANPALRLKLDMFASVRVPTTFSKRALAVPVSAMQQVEGKNVLFAQKSATSFVMRPVQSGVTVNGQIEIVSGISQGEMVVTKGAFHLKSIVVGKDLGED